MWTLRVYRDAEPPGGPIKEHFYLDRMVTLGRDQMVDGVAEAWPTFEDTFELQLVEYVLELIFAGMPKEFPIRLPADAGGIRPGEDLDKASWRLTGKDALVVNYRKKVTVLP
jgi:hypothetical protein